MVNRADVCPPFLYFCSSFEEYCPMKINKHNNHSGKAVLMFAFCLLAVSCAKIVTPSGGAIDRTPPKAVRFSPAQNSTHFDKTEFRIDFDEYIVLDNVREKLIISPTPKVKPEVTAKLKSIYVKGLDSLEENTTYIFDFADAICDFNEGNRLNGFKYAFSTGETTDSLIFEGRALDAFSLKGVANKYVILFADTNLNNIYATDGQYITKTDSNGWFAFSNLSKRAFRLLILEDKNQNRRFDLPTESVGFSSSAITPYVSDSTSFETKKRNLFYYSEPVDTTQKLLSSTFWDNNVFSLSFAMPLGEDFAFEWNKKSLGSAIETNLSAGRDTLWLYCLDKKGFDTIDLKIADGNFVEYVETVKAPVRKKDENTPLFAFSFCGKDSLDCNDRTLLRSPIPLKSKQIPVRLITDADTFSVHLIQIDRCHFALPPELEEGRKYTIQIDSAAVEDLAGRSNSAFERTFYLMRRSDYGNLIVNFADGTFANTARIFYLTNLKGEIIQQQIAKPFANQVIFKHIKEGVYRLKCCSDANSDGKWTSSDWHTGTQAERVTAFDKLINIKKSWDLEEEWQILW